MGLLQTCPSSSRPSAAATPTRWFVQKSAALSGDLRVGTHASSVLASGRCQMDKILRHYTLKAEFGVFVRSARWKRAYPGGFLFEFDSGIIFIGRAYEAQMAKYLPKEVVECLQAVNLF